MRATAFTLLPRVRVRHTSVLTAAPQPAACGVVGRSLPLLERLCAHGWRYDPEPARPVVVGSDVFLATPLVRAVGGWRGILIEWPGRPGIPPQEVRRVIHARAGRGRGVVTLFTDAAGVREVRGWRTPPGLTPSLYREDHRRRQPPGAPECPPERVASAPRSASARRGVDETAAAFISSLGPLPGSWATGSVGSVAALIGWLGVQADPNGVRRVWRRLQCFRVLDPAVGDGLWLLGALEVLVAIGAACLDRVEGWVEDLHALDPGRRRKGADLVRLLNRRDEIALDGGRDRMVYELVLLGCLRGLARDRREAAEVRRRLAARVPSGSVPVGHTAGLVEVHAEPAGGRGVRSATAASVLRAQGRMLTRADALLRRLRLEGAGTLDELREGRRAVARRRGRLIRGVTRLGWPIDGCTEWMLGGGFHLVRAATAEGAGDGRAQS